MKSKVNIDGHSVHAILVGFPITLYVGTLLFDILTIANDNPSLQQTAHYLNIGAIATALLAAVPGIIDFIYTVPPNSSGKKRGAKHGILNITIVALFALALYWRGDWAAKSTTILIIEIIGIILLGFAGWMGGTLMTRNYIGIDLRYAESGKWKEEYIKTNEKLVQVATINELQMNQMKLIHLNGKRIVIGRSDGGYAAFEDRCTHRGGSLAAGALMCNTVQCPWHGSQFNILSGAVTAGPAKEGIAAYKVRVEGDKVMIEAPTL